MVEMRQRIDRGDKAREINDTIEVGGRGGIGKNYATNAQLIGHV